MSSAQREEVFDSLVPFDISLKMSSTMTETPVKPRLASSTGIAAHSSSEAVLFARGKGTYVPWIASPTSWTRSAWDFAVSCACTTHRCGLLEYTSPSPPSNSIKEQSEYKGLSE